eukprot:scaffold11039_cov58-Attheya_sp.AAC.2
MSYSMLISITILAGIRKRELYLTFFYHAHSYYKCEQQAERSCYCIFSHVSSNLTPAGAPISKSSHLSLILLVMSTNYSLPKMSQCNPNSTNENSTVAY